MNELLGRTEQRRWPSRERWLPKGEPTALQQPWKHADEPASGTLLKIQHDASFNVVIRALERHQKGCTGGAFVYANLKLLNHPCEELLFISWSAGSAVLVNMSVLREVEAETGEPFSGSLLQLQRFLCAV